jgi:acetyltransferase
MLAGGKLAPLAPETLAALDAALPPFWSHADPVDVLGDATPERFRLAAEACVKDPTADGLLVLLTPQAMTEPTATARAVADATRDAGKPVLACWMGGAAVRPGRDVLAGAGVPTFDAPEPAVAAFLHMVEYRRNQELLYETPQAIPGDWRPGVDDVQAVFARARAAGRTLLTEAEAKEVLAAYGLPVAPAVACRDAAEAVAAAARIGYPVVLKLLSTTLTHKSDVGGVRLNLADADAVRGAFTAIRDAVARHGRPEAFEGVTVQPMVGERGLELIVGSSVDAQFGPVILFGAGGMLVEVLRDRALALPPLNRTLARRLMERTRIYPALKGVRGQRPVNLEALETLLVRFSQFLVDFTEVAEVDMNPLLATPERVVALDARVLLAPPGAPRPRLAVHPYPNQYTAPVSLRDGTRAVVRALGPEDEPLIVAMHGRLSPHTVRMRFFSLVKTLSRDSLIRLCHLDYDREMALAAVTADGGTMLGVSRYYLRAETGEAEFALVVSDAHQRQGLGRHLLERLIAVARERGVRKLTGLILAENEPMLRLSRSLGFREPEPAEDGVSRVELSLQ